MEANDNSFFSDLPKEMGKLTFIIFGLLILAAAWFNWEWMFEDGDSGNIISIAWISNTFGRTIARIVVGVMGVILILCGIVLFCLAK